jgi:hypothetical protein
MGSKAFTAVARSVHTVMPDPDDETGERKLFGTPKNNLGRTDLATIAYTIVSHSLETDEGTARTGRLVWGDERAESIGEAMGRASDTDRTATNEAADWLDDSSRCTGACHPPRSARRGGQIGPVGAVSAVGATLGDPALNGCCD